jgi:multicomponent Na+:H+ antiporter subunit F
MNADVLSFVGMFVMPVLGLSALLSGWRVLRGPTLADRVVGLELLATVGIGLAACAGLLADQAALLDVSLVLALVAFLATIAYARVLPPEK